MSGFDALGAAAAIIQLTETGIKYGRKAIAIYQSKQGLDDDLRSLDQVTEEFRSRSRNLVDGYIRRSGSPSPAKSGRDTQRMPWTLTMLQECAAALVGNQLKVEGREVCFCFFIDGLDETGDNTVDIITTLESLAAGANIKICASSRPWNEFESAFNEVSRRGNSIEVHLHTTKDIAIVVNTELNDVLKKLGRKRGELDTLVSRVIEMSHGVFLWVILVLRRELIPMLKAWETLDSLERRLYQIPNDLIPYFEDILTKVWEDTKFRRDTARIFLTCITAKQPIPLACLEIMVSDDPEHFAHEGIGGVPFRWGDADRIRAATAQVRARCLDLLCVEAVDPGEAVNNRVHDTPSGLHRIDFLHRTVADFLVEHAVAQDLNKYSGPDFDAETTLFACYAFLVRESLTLGPEHGVSTMEKASSWSTVSLFYCPRYSNRSSTATLISDIDESMERLSRSMGNAHWTNYTVSPQSRDAPPPKFFAERARRDLIAHLIEFGIYENVRARLSKVPELITDKKGRPYLDYALRHDRGAVYRVVNQQLIPLKIKFDVRLAEMLISLGCSVNQAVGIYDRRTVWDLYLSFMYDSRALIDTASALKLTQALIRAGAKDVPRCILSETSKEETAKFRETALRPKEMPMQQILEQIFGPEQGAQLTSEVKKNSTTSWLSWMPLFGG